MGRNPTDLCTVALFRHNWRAILKDDCRNIWSDFQSIVNGVLEFFSTIDVHFTELFFSVGLLSTVSVYTFLFCSMCMDIGWE